MIVSFRQKSLESNNYLVEGIADSIMFLDFSVMKVLNSKPRHAFRLITVGVIFKHFVIQNVHNLYAICYYYSCNYYAMIN